LVDSFEFTHASALN